MIVCAKKYHKIYLNLFLKRCHAQKTLYDMIYNGKLKIYLIFYTVNNKLSGLYEQTLKILNYSKEKFI